MGVTLYACGAPLIASAGSAEIIIGNHATTLDTKISASFSDNFSITGRTRATVDYVQGSSFLQDTHFLYKLPYGFQLDGELQITQSVMPRFGFEWSHEFSSLFVYGLATYSLQDPYFAEFAVVLQWTPVVNSSNWYARIESIHDIGSTYIGDERVWLGIQHDSFRSGFMMETVHPSMENNTGIFAGVTF